jgi:hypothetical protein
MKTVTLVLSKIVSGVKQPDTGRTVSVRNLAGTTIATATETPASSGQYEATFNETSTWGYFYVDGVQKPGYSNNSPFWLGLYHVVSGSAATFSAVTSATMTTTGITANTLSLNDGSNRYFGIYNSGDEYYRAYLGTEGSNQPALQLTDADTATILRADYEKFFIGGNGTDEPSPAYVLYANRESGRVGIAKDTTAINATLDVGGSALISGSLVVSQSIKVASLGIGKTPASGYELDILSADGNCDFVMRGLGDDDGIGTNGGTFAINKIDGATGQTQIAASGDISISPTNNLLIGKTSPSNAKLDVNGNAIVSGTFVVSGSGNSYFIGNGNVGIGTTAPVAKLQVVKGTTGITFTPNAREVAIFENDLSNGTAIDIVSPATGVSAIYFSGVTTNARGQISYDHVDDSFAIYSAPAGTIMKMLSNGNVGIGTTSPLAKLNVVGNIAVSGVISVGAAPASGYELTLKSMDGANCDFIMYGATAGSFAINQADNGSTLISASRTMYFTSGSGINPTGIFRSVAVGDSSGASIFEWHTSRPSSKDTYVRRGGIFGDNTFFGMFADSLPMYLRTTGANSMYLQTNGATRMTLDANGVGIGGGTSASYALYVTGAIGATGNVTGGLSDIRVKKNLVPIEDPLEKLRKLHGYTFEWAKDPFGDGRVGKKEVGFVAQEVEAVLPEAVGFNEAVGYKTIYLDKVTPLLLEALRKLDDEVRMLKDKLYGCS